MTFCRPTIFYRIQAPARTTKYPEGRLYSVVIISKSERCRAALGIPELLVLFLILDPNMVFLFFYFGTGPERTIKTFPSSPLKMCESAQSMSN